MPSTRTPKVVRSKLNASSDSTHGIAPLSGRGHWCWPDPGRRALRRLPWAKGFGPVGAIAAGTNLGSRLAEPVRFVGAIAGRDESLLKTSSFPSKTTAPLPRILYDPRAPRKRAPQGTRPMAFSDASWPDARHGETSALKIAERARLSKERSTPRRGEIIQPRASAARRAALGRRSVSPRTPKVVRSTLNASSDSSHGIAPLSGRSPSLSRRTYPGSCSRNSRDSCRRCRRQASRYGGGTIRWCGAGRPRS
ncbi:MAG: hypothetical protein PWP23_2386 [Candidatus Sumerlaeota bacterium]|nr:hypothetical protein [Candidatus Sumerlaeota bacterium]